MAQLIKLGFKIKSLICSLLLGEVMYLLPIIFAQNSMYSKITKVIQTDTFHVEYRINKGHIHVYTMQVQDMYKSITKLILGVISNR